MSDPYPPPEAWPPPAPRRSPTTRWIGIGLLVVGTIAFVAAFAALGSSGGPDDYQVVPVPGQRSLDLDAGTVYVLYLEHAKGSAAPDGTPTVRVTAPSGDGEPVLAMPDWASTYSSATRSSQGRPFGSIHPAVSGAFRFEVDDAPAGTGNDALKVAVGPDISDSDVVASLVAMAGLLAAVAGGIVLIVRAVRQRRTPFAAGGAP